MVFEDNLSCLTRSPTLGGQYTYFGVPRDFWSIWVGKQIDRDAKISKNHIYTSEVWIWFFGNIGLEVVFLWNISHQLVTPCALVIIDLLHPEYIWVLPWKLEEEKIEKTISIPVRYRFGFLEILLKTHPNRYAMHLHESNMCSFAEDISKTAKNNKKPYLYHTGIDMVWAKMSKASLLYHPLKQALWATFFSRADETA